MIDRSGRTRGLASRRPSVVAPILLVALAALAGLTGCPRHGKVARPYAPPTAAALGAIVETRQQAVRTMNARVRATSWLGGDRIRATVLMLVERPGRLRFEAEVSLQGTVAVLATDGRDFQFLDTVKNELRRGPACAANVASLIRIPFPPADVAAILLGDARLPFAAPPAASAGGGPAGDPYAAATVDWDGDRGADVLVLPRKAGLLRYHIEGADGPLDRARLVTVTASDLDGRMRWRVSFEDFTDVATAGRGGTSEPVPLPSTILFAEGDASFDDGVEIKFKERALNDEAAPGSFVLLPPAGAPVIDVGCPGS